MEMPLTERLEVYKIGVVPFFGQTAHLDKRIGYTAHCRKDYGKVLSAFVIPLKDPGHHLDAVRLGNRGTAKF
jgi:hypothetical protein